MYVFFDETMKVPAKVYHRDHRHPGNTGKCIEAGAIEQLINTARLPFAFHHVVLNADGHQGYGMPIGGVLATQNVIIPHAVGVDIGCTMSALKLGFKKEQITKEVRLKIHEGIKKTIPMGYEHHKDRQDPRWMPSTSYQDLFIVKQQYESAIKQVGTLGGGNHFIELQADQNDDVWIMVHTGSRNLGKKVADHYDHMAKELNKKYWSQVPEAWQLAFLPIGTREAGQYIEEMKYCMEFARLSHTLIQTRLLEIIADAMHGAAAVNTMQVCSHNYARIEHHFGEDVWVHRKGATSARLGETGIIPGSMGSCSYIVKGKGNLDSFTSCSHGAGRALGRKAAKRALNLEEEKKLLDDQGIVHSLTTTNSLEEATHAYKDVSDVMEQQTELVEIAYTLKPLVNVKDEKEEED